MNMPLDYSEADHLVGNAKPLEMSVPVKAVIPGTTMVLLENGDTILFQIVPENVRLVLGQKDANGNPVYNFDARQGVTVIPGTARTRDGTDTTADADGRHGEQPG